VTSDLLSRQRIETFQARAVSVVRPHHQGVPSCSFSMRVDGVECD
jgi:hypothetical protein